MKTIRKGIFETNSSSVHSLSIVTNNDKEISQAEILIVVPNEYGRGYEILRSPEEKTSYLMSLIASYSGFSWYEEEEGIQFTEEEFFSLPDAQKVVEAIKKHGSRILYKRGYASFGRVDHQSVVSLEEFLGGVDLEDFIFNYKYTITIDSD